MQKGRPKIEGPRLPSGKLRGKMPLNARQKRQVKSLITRNVETRYHDSIQTGLGPTAAGAFYDLSLIPNVNRQGDEALISLLEVRLNMLAADITNNIRAIIFRWLPSTNVQAPSTTSLLQSGATQPIVSGFSISNNGPLFKVLYDKVYDFSSNGVATLTKNMRFYGKSLGLKKLDFVTGATSGFNHIFLALYSDSAAIPNPTVNFYSRLLYKDA